VPTFACVLNEWVSIFGSWKLIFACAIPVSERGPKPQFRLPSWEKTAPEVCPAAHRTCQTLDACPGLMAAVSDDEDQRFKESCDFISMLKDRVNLEGQIRQRRHAVSVTLKLRN